jgi:exodeoxyribonuclease VII large subunit
MLEHRRSRLAAAARGLPRPDDLLAIATQRLDIASGRLGAALQRNVSAHARELTHSAARLRPSLLERPIQVGTERLARLAVRLKPAVQRRLERDRERLDAWEKLRLSLNPDGPLERGFARVHHADGRLARRSDALATGETVTLKFADGQRGALVDATAPPPPRPAPSRAPPRQQKVSPNQGELF